MGKEADRKRLYRLRKKEEGVIPSAEDRAKSRARSREYYHKNKDKQRIRKQVARKNPLNVLRAARRDAKRRAEKKGREYTLPDNWGEDLIEYGCALSGRSFRSEIFTGACKSHNTHPFTISIDRIDNDKGYTPDNCQLVCSALNFAKGQLSQDMFIQLCREVAEKDNSDRRRKDSSP